MNDTQIQDFCRDCRFWRLKADNSTKGECHHNSPQPLNMDSCAESRYLVAVWPTTLDMDWCGEFERDGIYEEQSA